MKWYDVFSKVYDSSLEKLYAESRKRAVELLDLEPGQVLIDIACGTGANFKYIIASTEDLEIYGTDFSEGMLKKAQILIHKNDWENIALFQADARELTPAYIKEQTNKNLAFDRIICVLGLSVIPDWEDVLDKMLQLLNGARENSNRGCFRRKEEFQYLVGREVCTRRFEP